jgi:perosamine synthetase
MVLTNDESLGERIRQFKGQGQDPKRRYWFPVIGYNYRMTNIEAALGLAQFEKIDHYLAARDEIDKWYRSELKNQPGISLPAKQDHERSVCWLFSVVLNESDEMQRDQVILNLREAGIDTRPFFYPCHILPPYTNSPGASDCANAEWLGQRGFSLPTWVGLTHEQVRRITDALVAALRKSIGAVGEAGLR